MAWDHSDTLDDEGLNELIRRFPPSLFKYSGLAGDRLEWMRRLIVDSDLYFAKPSSFNDPLDCRIPPRFEGSRLVVEQHWRGVARRNFPSMTPRDRKARVQQAVRKSSTPEGQAGLTKSLLDGLAENGTVCFATDPINMLMWSYYAEGHSGIAVRFGMNLSRYEVLARALLAQGTHLFPLEVQYSKDFPNCNYYTAKMLERIKVLLGTKAEAWRHEGEWRFVLPKRSGYFKIPPASVTGVVLGMRIDSGHESAIRKWIANRSPTVELLRVSHKPNSFQLELVPA